MLCVTGAALYFSSAAYAQSSGAYLYITGGTSSAGVECAVGQECNKSGTALIAGAGYRFTSGLSVEGVLGSLGTARGSVRGFPAEVETNSFGAAATYQIPIGQNFDITARIGVASMSTGVRGIIGGQVQGAQSDRYFKPFVGLEGSWAFSKQFAATVLVNSWSSETFSRSLQIQSLTVGLRTRF